MSDGVLFKGNMEEGSYKLIKTTDGWVLVGKDIVFAGSDITDRPQGEWIIHKINGIPHTAECSCCHNHYDYEDLRRIGGIKEIIALPYCPNCGCRMKGADDEV